MHERAAAGRPLELGRRIGACLPHPTQVQLEPEQLGGQRAQLVEQRVRVVELGELAPVVVEAQAQPVLARLLGDGGDARDDRPRGVARLGRIDPAERDPVATERPQLFRQRRQLQLERVQAGMPPRGDEPELVQPPAHLDCVVAVQVEELDTVVADLPHRPEHAFEIARAVVANRVQLQRDAGHRRLATGAGRLLSISSRYRKKLSFGTRSCVG